MPGAWPEPAAHGSGRRWDESRLWAAWPGSNGLPACLGVPGG